MIQVPAGRFARWVENFARERTGLHVHSTATGLRGETDDGSWFSADFPFAGAWATPADRELELVPAFLAALSIPEAWGVLLVRKGGFATARLAGTRLVEHKIGQRHVQGRTKAGGQSQQRFARRRDNQARQAYEAAAGHAQRILGPLPQGSPVVTAGDPTAIAESLAETRLDRLQQVPLAYNIGDPKRVVLDDVVHRAQSVQIAVHNA